MTEIKMVYEEIHPVIDELSGKANALEPSAPEPISGNTLDVADKLNDLMTHLEQMLVKYRTVLQTNIETTKKSVEFMEETDNQVATAIDGSGGSSGGPAPHRNGPVPIR
ncbi:hypothetical protein AV656_06475 [Bhargavaea cecembensis]|uniref:YwqI/YxiC family protein n=1 Tax=Bhargavaea cecembensis TaxID=394098 RepID=A0A161RJV0_9BACL|nr:YwqI/YxiC family protein [Bhargavaea cecembensis]KZE38548.1 hypothetical protein AV656_06475 [Bhargavaea cecembensis]